ncbi:MAG: hypothetical protein AAFS10_19160, partial [Myxococcota bacterium]
VLADGNPATDDVPRKIPYEGIMELDGQPLNALNDDAIRVRFELFDGENADTFVYSQNDALNVYQGRFKTALGPTGVDAQGNSVDIADIVRNADNLYLAMTLLGDDDDSTSDDTPLAGRQEIGVTPYAMWASTATDLTVARDLVVARNLNVAGTIAANTLNVDQVLSTDTLNATTTRTDNLNVNQLISGTSLSIGGQATVGGNLVVNGDYIRLPKRNTNPGTCNSGRVGWIYMDTDAEASYQIPCVCIQARTAGEYRWAPFYSVGEGCED